MDFKSFVTPVIFFEAVPHNEMASHSKLLSTAELDYSIYIKVPAEFARHFELCQISEIKETEEIVPGEGLWEHDPCRIWYRFLTVTFNTETGYHSYRLLFANKVTNEVCSLFISYTIQTNNPEKPYNYMAKYDKETT